MADKFDEMAGNLAPQCGDHISPERRKQNISHIAAALRTADSAGYARCREEVVAKMRQARDIAVTKQSATVANVLQVVMDGIAALPTSTDRASNG